MTTRSRSQWLREEQSLSVKENPKDRGHWFRVDLKEPLTVSVSAYPKAWKRCSWVRVAPAPSQAAITTRGH